MAHLVFNTSTGEVATAATKPASMEAAQWAAKPSVSQPSARINRLEWSYVPT